LLVLAACGSSGGSGPPESASTFAGRYNATFTGTFQNTSPNDDSGTSTSTAVITVTNVSATEVELSWQVPPNPPSGTAFFQMTGSAGTLLHSDADAGGTTGTAVTGSCFTGIVNGNTQTNCCTDCTVSFTTNGFTQPNSGTYTGTTPAGVAYTGVYAGTWIGTRQ
jgi:hypothetical protein